jgi:hypothetical protein
MLPARGPLALPFNSREIGTPDGSSGRFIPEKRGVARGIHLGVRPDALGITGLPAWVPYQGSFDPVRGAAGASALNMTAPLDGVQPLFITVDPERDTPAHLADYVAFFHPRLIGLTGDAKHIQDAARAYKRYSDGREEADVMWSALRLVESQFAEAGLAPR